MADQNTGFMLDSKEEIEKKSGAFTPLESEDYIVKLAKIDLVQKASYVNNTWDYSKLVWAFECICIVQGLKAGGDMRDDEKESVLPFTRYIYREINPHSVGFMPDKVTPSFLRGIVAYLEGTDINKSIKAPNFILLDVNKKVVDDVILRQKFLDQVTEGKTMDGYTGLPDIRAYEGRYIGTAVEVKTKNDKKSNRVTKFSKLPQNFVVPTPEVEAAAMENFNKYYTEKVLPRREDRLNEGLATSGGAPTAVQGQSAEELGEVKMDEVVI